MYESAIAWRISTPIPNWPYAHRHTTMLRKSVEQLRQLRTNYFIRCRALIRSQSELLSAMEADQQKDFEQPAVPQNDGYVLT